MIKETVCCGVCEKDINPDIDPHFEHEITGVLVCSVGCILDANDLVARNQDLDTRCPNAQCRSTLIEMNHSDEIDGDGCEQISCSCPDCNTTWVMQRELTFTGISDICIGGDDNA